MREHGLSTRAFARLLAGGDDATDAQAETARSNLHRWLIGKHTPTRLSVSRIARALNEPEERLLSALPDFGANRDRVASLEDAVDELRAELDLANRSTRGLLRRVKALEEAGLRSPREGRATPGDEA